MDDAPDDFSGVMKALGDFLQPVADSYEKKDKFDLKWAPGGPWHD